MDKTIILSVAGSGKTKTIIDKLTINSRALVITYTDNNYNNIKRRIENKFDNIIPKNISLMTYFSFLFNFCYKPFLSDEIKAKGIIFETNPNKYCNDSNCKFYLSNGYFYSNRLAYFLDKSGITDDIKKRLEKYFDLIIIDEIQDIAGRDFNFLLNISSSNTNFLYVGDFYQHTYDTSLDGNVNKSLFDCYDSYINKFKSVHFKIDTSTLLKSWRCSPEICEFITNKLGITILSNKPSGINSICFIDDEKEIKNILRDKNIIKLHYQNSAKYGIDHKNWGDTKGEDEYNDVCVLLNKTSFEKYTTDKLASLPARTKNKLYVALTRAHGNIYLVDESSINSFLIGKDIL